MREWAVSTSTPLRSCAMVRSSSALGVRAPFTCGRWARLVFCKTRLMSGCAMRLSRASMARARPVLPTLIWETTSRMNLRFTSAAAAQLAKPRVLRQVEPAAAPVRDEPRDEELLAVGGVDVGQLGDRRRLALQAEGVELARVEGGVGRGQ